MASLLGIPAIVSDEVRTFHRMSSEVHSHVITSSADNPRILRSRRIDVRKIVDAAALLIMLSISPMNHTA